MLATLNQRLELRSATVAVVGLGYVGLPVACLLAEVGFQVVGVDINQLRVAEINDGICPIRGIEPGLAELVTAVVTTGNLRATTDYAALTSAQVILIAVDTPVDDLTHRPHYQALISALTGIGEVLQNGTLIIIESTISPGTMSLVVEPTLEKASGLSSGVDFWIGHCPERVMPGRLLHNLKKMDRVVGGQTPDVAAVMMTLYRTYVEGTLDLTDPLTAELVKTGENTYRDINIAFANEMALICEAAGGDVWAVRTLLNKSPGRQMLLPGAGVGGHCIPKDPWLLAHGADGLATLIPTARAINEGMPAHVARLALNALGEAGQHPGASRVAVLGYAYLEDSDDTRHTPTQALIDVLGPQVAALTIHDPFVHDYMLAIEDVVQDADCVIVMVAHSAYRSLDLQSIASRMRTRVLIDSRNVFTADALASSGFTYRKLGIAGQAVSTVVQKTR
jgi:UDP-N-acetyl-D-mannosaminuronic acid dehydrogenase